MNVTFNDSLAKIAINKSLLKEFNSSNERIVYLNNNSEFQIQIFNPYDYTIGADISINGNKMSNRIIIKPGQRIWLERYLDDAKKFLFSTYEIENSPEAKYATRNNGVIEIKFYKERKVETNFISSVTYQPRIYYNDYNGVCGVLNANSVNYCDSAATLSLDCTTTAKDNTGVASYASTACYSATIDDAVSTERSLSNINNEIETGRIEKGSHSSQRFDTIDLDFDYWSFKTETIKLLPMSRKPYTDADLKKIYCSNCGRKLKTKFNFCPYCGSKL